MLKKILNSIKVLYSPEYPRTITYMLQNTEYRIWPYLNWFWRTQDFSRVRNRRSLDKTLVAKLIMTCLKAGIALEVLAGIILIFLTIGSTIPGGWGFGLALIIGFPVIWSLLICLPVFAARQLLIKPRQKQAIKQTKQIFADHPGIKIAVAGSYGKTSMKELLKTVLGKGKDVAATPANKNVALSHYQFAKSLTGKEDVVIVEFGEAGPGDVARFSDTLKPDIAVITGVSAAHLDRYKTVERAAEDIFSLSRLTKKSQVYVNKESAVAAKHMPSGCSGYDRHGALGWRVEDVSSTISGLKFKLVKGKKSLSLHSALLGQHQLGPLALVAALAKELGLSDQQVEAGIKETKPYEHRMEPYLMNDAWIIDDSYNGNLEGIRAGTALLKELSAQRKTYVTPGLVDQGKETQQIHEEVGKLIAEAQPDKVVLMTNSVTESIMAGLKEVGYKGEIDCQGDPLSYYQDLPNFLAAGDIVLMQNDWTDNYT